MPYFKRTSIRDIAEAAGVSTTLVSFVLNGKANEYRINEETAQRAIENYRRSGFRHLQPFLRIHRTPI